MRWSPGADRSNVEDRRGMRVGPVGMGGSILALVLSLIFGRDFVGGGGSDVNQQTSNGEVAPVQQTPAEAREVEFVTFVLDTAQATWKQVFSGELGRPWRDAKLVL